MALSDDGVYRWRVLMCSDQYIAGDTAWDAPTRLALNEWGYIYIPMSAFISGGNGFDKKCFVSVTFNKPQDGNADNVKEVRFADFELIKAAEGELVADKLSYTPQENPAFTANVTPDLGYNVEIRQNGETVTTLEKVEGKYVWEGAKNAGTYEAVIVLTDGGYYLQGEYSVTFYITEETQASNVVFEPTAENAASQIKTSKPCTVEAKTGDPNAAYTGDYVSFSGAGTNVWVDIMLTAESPLEQYAKYDVIEFWIYADAKDNTEVKFSLFNDLAYQKVFKADTWTKLTVSAADFVTEMAEDNLFLPFNMMNANSTNHASLTELRIGAVYVKYSVDYTVETEGLEIAGGETADVAITVSCDNEEIPSYELIVSKDGVKQAASSGEGNIHHYTLTAGVYDYSLQATDMLYSGEANGTFTVNSSIKIILPEAAAATAGTAYDIPEAQVSVNGEISGNKAETRGKPQLNT